MTIRQNLDVYQGATFSYSFTWKDGSGSPIDLTGYEAIAAVKRDLFAPEDVVFSSLPSEQYLGSIELGGVDGTIELQMTADQTNSADNTSAFLNIFLDDPHSAYIDVITYRYDLKLTAPSGQVDRVLEGYFSLHRAVTF